jgi:hypothetical protein
MLLIRPLSINISADGLMTGTQTKSGVLRFKALEFKAEPHIKKRT